MLLAGQGIEVTGFNLMHELDRFAFGRDQIKPAPRHHQARGQAENVVGDGIAMMMVVEQPRVDVAFAQRRLDGGEVHGQTPIVNKREDLGEFANVFVTLRRCPRPPRPFPSSASASSRSMWCAGSS